jgi:hypothetical protein
MDKPKRGFKHNMRLTHTHSHLCAYNTTHSHILFPFIFFSLVFRTVDCHATKFFQFKEQELESERVRERPRVLTWLLTQIVTKKALKSFQERKALFVAI